MSTDLTNKELVAFLRSTARDIASRKYFNKRSRTAICRLLNDMAGAYREWTGTTGLERDLWRLSARVMLKTLPELLCLYNETPGVRAKDAKVRIELCYYFPAVVDNIDMRFAVDGKRAPTVSIVDGVLPPAGTTVKRTDADGTSAKREGNAVSFRLPGKPGVKKGADVPANKGP